MNFSFSGCGFLGIYHVGVAAALKEYAPDLVVRKISGASGGAIAACALICDLCLGQACSDVLKVAIMARQRALGPLHPSFNLTSIIREGLEHFLPENAHEIATGRLHISLTRMSDGVNVLVNEYKTKVDLIDALLCSAFIPFYSGTVPPTYQGVHYIDGGWSDNLPVLDEHTITVSPFSGEADVCPADPESGSFLVFDLKNTTIRFTNQNLYRIAVALFPPHPEVMSDMCRQGFEDTLRFLARHNLISCTRCIAIRSSIILAGGPTDETSGAETPGDSSSPADRASVPRVLPKSYTNVRAGTVNSFDCPKCQETAARAPKKGLPRAVRRSLADASTENDSLLNYVFSSRPMTMLRYLLLPWMLPVDFFMSYFKRLSDRFPSLYEASKEMMNFLLKQVDLNVSEQGSNFICQLAVTEMNFSNISSDVADTFGLFEAPSVEATSAQAVRVPSASKLVTTEMNFGFAVDMEEDSKPAKRASSMMANDVPERSDYPACSVSKMMDDLEWTGFKRAAASATPLDASEASLEAGDIDTVSSILDYSRKHDALMAFYYMDEAHRMKMTEIYGVEPEHLSKADKTVPASTECDLNDSGVSMSKESRKALSAKRMSDRAMEVKFHLGTANKDGSNQASVAGSHPVCRRGSLSRHGGRKSRSALTLARAFQSNSESDTDALFMPGRSRRLTSENVSYEGDSSDMSE